MKLGRITPVMVGDIVAIVAVVATSVVVAELWRRQVIGLMIGIAVVVAVVAVLLSKRFRPNRAGSTSRDHAILAVVFAGLAVVTFVNPDSAGTALPFVALVASLWFVAAALWSRARATRVPSNA